MVMACLQSNPNETSHFHPNAFVLLIVVLQENWKRESDLDCPSVLSVGSRMTRKRVSDNKQVRLRKSTVAIMKRTERINFTVSERQTSFPLAPARY